jgi:hypothetical protein
VYQVSCKRATFSSGYTAGMDHVLMNVAIGLLFGGALVCFIARVRFGLPRLGIVWWAGVAISSVGFLGMIAVGYFGR